MGAVGCHTGYGPPVAQGFLMQGQPKRTAHTSSRGVSIPVVGVVALSVIGMPNLAVRMISCLSVYTRDYLEENHMKELNICKL